MTSTELAGSTALVTGATSGIGRAVALSLARQGAHVLVGGRDVARGDAVVATVRSAGGKADLLLGDLADARGVRAMARRAGDAGGGHVDILVNNAAVYPARGLTPDTTHDDFLTCYAVNVEAPLLLVAELCPAMAARRHGSVVNVLSMTARFGMAGFALYGSSKAALLSLTQAWTAEFGPRGVRVNAVSAGPTRTEGTQVFGDGLDRLAAPAPAGRPAAPEEIAAAVTFLAGHQASFVNGAVLDVDGGRHAT
jgi:NAD(P)-dependent dehydrogenase (short-subunit alcohol dehydrogenase family)